MSEARKSRNYTVTLGCHVSLGYYEEKDVYVDAYDASDAAYQALLAGGRIYDSCRVLNVAPTD